MGTDSTIPSTTTAKTAPPCADNPQAWDLDKGTILDWITALRICTAPCPLLTACWEARRRQYPDGHNPAGVIWAGEAFTDTGQLMRDPGALLAYGSQRDMARRTQRAA